MVNLKRKRVLSGYRQMEYALRKMLLRYLYMFFDTLRLRGAPERLRLTVQDAIDAMRHVQLEAVFGSDYENN